MANEQTQVGTIQQLTEKVVATDYNGSERILNEGDALYLGDLVETTSPASGSIKLFNGDIVPLVSDRIYSLKDLLIDRGFTTIAEMQPSELLQVLESIDEGSTAAEKEQAINAINQLTSGPGSEKEDTNQSEDVVTADNQSAIDAINQLNENNPPAAGDGQPALGPPAAGTGAQNQGANSAVLLEQESTEGNVTPGHDRGSIFLTGSAATEQNGTETLNNNPVPTISGVNLTDSQAIEGSESFIFNITLSNGFRSSATFPFSLGGGANGDPAETTDYSLLSFSNNVTY
ncbi:hypothetical protein EOPP23_17285, partial [Endozoicomonas sp. OPT23]|uniref:hypothetical protein n=1 Tax=Endozoicomonas sp. OPT23 TaxID=2072845 RepID=UPI0018917F73